MPFERVEKDTYKSPSGRTFTGAQVRLYHAHDGFPSRGGHMKGGHMAGGYGKGSAKTPRGGGPKRG